MDELIDEMCGFSICQFALWSMAALGPCCEGLNRSLSLRPLLDDALLKWRTPWRRRSSTDSYAKTGYEMLDRVSDTLWRAAYCAEFEQIYPAVAEIAYIAYGLDVLRMSARRYSSLLYAYFTQFELGLVDWSDSGPLSAPYSAPDARHNLRGFVELALEGAVLADPDREAASKYLLQRATILRRNGVGRASPSHCDVPVNVMREVIGDENFFWKRRPDWVK